MLGLLNKTLEVFAVLWRNVAPCISCPWPWFRPQSSTANLFGFNQSSTWLMTFPLFPFLKYLLSVNVLVSSPLLSLSTQHFVLFIPSLFYSFCRPLLSYLSTCIFFHASALPFKCKCYGKNLSDTHTSTLSQGYGLLFTTFYRGPNLTELYENSLAEVCRLLSSHAWVQK